MHQKDPDIAFCGVLLHSDGTCYYVDGTANVPNSGNTQFHDIHVYDWSDTSKPITTLVMQQSQ